MDTNEVRIHTKRHNPDIDRRKHRPIGDAAVANGEALSFPLVLATARAVNKMKKTDG
jgi:hypothetical protein